MEQNLIFHLGDPKTQTAGENLHFDIHQAENILTSGIYQYSTRGELPNVGKDNYLYYVQAENAVYM